MIRLPVLFDCRKSLATWAFITTAHGATLLLLLYSGLPCTNGWNLWLSRDPSLVILFEYDSGPWTKIHDTSHLHVLHQLWLVNYDVYCYFFVIFFLRYYCGDNGACPVKADWIFTCDLKREHQSSVGASPYRQEMISHQTALHFHTPCVFNMPLFLLSPTEYLV